LCIRGNHRGVAKTSGTSEGAAMSASARIAARIEKIIFVITVKISRIYEEYLGTK
jgi:hypothetical protein